MSDGAIRKQVELCESTRGTDTFAVNVETLLTKLPPRLRARVEADESVYKLSEGYANRFINNVLITVEFVTVKTFDHETLFAAIKSRLDDA